MFRRAKRVYHASILIANNSVTGVSDIRVSLRVLDSTVTGRRHFYTRPEFLHRK